MKKLKKLISHVNNMANSGNKARLISVIFIILIGLLVFSILIINIEKILGAVFLIGALLYILLGDKQYKPETISASIDFETAHKLVFDVLKDMSSIIGLTKNIRIDGILSESPIIKINNNNFLHVKIPVGNNFPQENLPTIHNMLNEEFRRQLYRIRYGIPPTIINGVQSIWLDEAFCENGYLNLIIAVVDNYPIYNYLYEKNKILQNSDKDF